MVSVMAFTRHLHVKTSPDVQSIRGFPLTPLIVNQSGDPFFVKPENTSQKDLKSTKPSYLKNLNAYVWRKDTEALHMSFTQQKGEYTDITHQFHAVLKRTTNEFHTEYTGIHEHHT